MRKPWLEHGATVVTHDYNQGQSGNRFVSADTRLAVDKSEPFIGARRHRRQSIPVLRTISEAPTENTFDHRLAYKNLTVAVQKQNRCVVTELYGTIGAQEVGWIDQRTDN